MVATRDPNPRRVAGYWLWPLSFAGGRLVFVGRGPRRNRERVLQEVGGGVPRASWLRQTHSADVRGARPGLSGHGDALVTEETDLAISVATADCLPIVIGDRHRLAVLHAGWRGLAAGIVPATIAALDRPAAELQSWIGPAIGSCCYEVGPEVAEKVAAASGPRVIIRRGGPRPYLDLLLAAELQLASLGVERIQALRVCTCCASEWLWSYRREGTGVGRNLAFAWRTGE